MPRWNLKVLFCATCIAAATACSSEDPSTEGGALQPFGGGGVGGSAGSSAGSAGSAGRAGGNAGGSSGNETGGSAGRSTGGTGGSNVAGSSGSNAGGSAGSAGTAGAAGAAGTSTEPSLPDAGAEPPAEEPGEDPVEEPPAEDVVGFSDIYPLLVTNCGQCHSGTPAFLPGFAQPDEAAASALVQPGGLADRIYARTVTERTMPPACRGGNFGSPGCVTQEEADLVQAWADGGYQP